MSEAQQWQPDPFGRHQLRYFADGHPTNWVSDGGRVVEDPTLVLQPPPGSRPSSQSQTHSSSPAPATAAAVAAGWLADPSNPNQLRYWDGSTWTSQFALNYTAGLPVASVPRPDAPGKGRRAAPSGRGRRIGIVLTAFIVAAGALLLTHQGDSDVLVLGLVAAAVIVVPVTGVFIVRAIGGRRPAPADWYPDPHKVAYQRWWDGEKWTEHTAGPPLPGQLLAEKRMRNLPLRIMGAVFTAGLLLWVLVIHRH
jgi:hypothetical protein